MERSYKYVTNESLNTSSKTTDDTVAEHKKKKKKMLSARKEEKEPSYSIITYVNVVIIMTTLYILQRYIQDQGVISKG